jgi:hypothetical protein
MSLQLVSLLCSVMPFRESGVKSFFASAKSSAVLADVSARVCSQDGTEKRETESEIEIEIEREVHDDIAWVYVVNGRCTHANGLK